MSIYHKYTNYVKLICDNGNIENFKSNSDYRDVLEHVNKEQGDAYLNLILNDGVIPKESIKEFCELNDKIGNPVKNNFVFGDASPTSLRYIYHSSLILSYLKVNLTLYLAIF